MTPSLPIRAVAAPFLAAALMAGAPAMADERTPRISVTGEGEAAVSPDMAILNLAVLREAETARAALDANSEAMAAVIAAMKEDGIAARDLQTGGLSIDPRYVHPNEDNDETQPRIVGYEVSNTLTVRVRDLDKLGAILDRSVTLGVNRGGDITFTNDDPSATLEKARKRAVENAFSKARTLAGAADVELGRVLRIAEQNVGRPPMPMQGRAMRMEAAADAVPVEAGENSYEVTVNVTFEIDQ